MINGLTDKENLAATWAEAKACLAEALPKVAWLMKEKFAEVHVE